ncbi:MAG: hypothetical protein JW918_10390 [Anaerolineae bacterium]|nr:hypothetical protein [Anaerolineae bacterium]
MAHQLEVEFRVYYIPAVGSPRECIATRSVPHALQVWNESVDAYSRSLELVISGDWLMKLLAEDGKASIEDPDELNRAAVIDLCLKALSTDDEQQKEACLKQVLKTLGYSLGKPEDE